MDDGLAHEGSTFINFRHYVPDPKEHGYRWVDIKQFHFAAGTLDDRGLLSALIEHEQFRDDYAGGGVLPDGPRHGPYWLGLITPDLYQPISQEKAVQILREWEDPLWEPPTKLEADLQRELFDRLAAAGAIYYLGELGHEANHDWGRVHDQFHEFVLIDRSAGADHTRRRGRRLSRPPSIPSASASAWAWTIRRRPSHGDLPRATRNAVIDHRLARHQPEQPLPDELLDPSDRP